MAANQKGGWTSILHRLPRKKGLNERRAVSELISTNFRKTTFHLLAEQ